jgi:hypothetical protein
VRDEGRCIARDERCYERQQQVLELDLDVVERKPGALIGSKPLASSRERIPEFLIVTQGSSSAISRDHPMTSDVREPLGQSNL